MDLSRDEMIQKVKDAGLYEEGMSDEELKELIIALIDSLETAEHESTFRGIQSKYDPEDALEGNWNESCNNLSTHSTPYKKLSTSTITKDITVNEENILSPTIEDILTEEEEEGNASPVKRCSSMINGNDDNENEIIETPYTRRKKKKNQKGIFKENVLMVPGETRYTDTLRERPFVKRNVIDTTLLMVSGESRNSDTNIERPFLKRYKTSADYISNMANNTNDRVTPKKHLTRSQQMILMATTAKAETETKALSFKSPLLSCSKEVKNYIKITKNDQNLTINNSHSNKNNNDDKIFNELKDTDYLMSKKLRSNSALRVHNQKPSLSISKLATTNKEIEDLLNDEILDTGEGGSGHNPKRLTGSELFDEVKSSQWMQKFPLQPFVKEKDSITGKDNYEPTASTSTNRSRNHEDGRSAGSSFRENKRHREESPDAVTTVRVKVFIHSPPKHVKVAPNVRRLRGRSTSADGTFRNIQIEYDKIQTEEEYKEAIKTAKASSTSVRSKATCPICQKEFSRSFIESHASTCGEK